MLPDLSLELTMSQQFNKTKFKEELDRSESSKEELSAIILELYTQLSVQKNVNQQLIKHLVGNHVVN